MNIQTIRKKTRARFNRRMEIGDEVYIAADRALAWADAELLDGHGVEHIIVPNGFSCNHFIEAISYVNMGDSYAETVIWDNKAKRFYSMSLGDFVEWQHKRFDEGE